VLLSTSKLALQAALEAGRITEDPTLTPELMGPFRGGCRSCMVMPSRPTAAPQIIATKIANRFVNRLGITALFTLTEEEGASFGQAAASFVAAERLFDMDALWHELDTIALPEEIRAGAVRQASQGLQFHVADLMRSSSGSTKIEEMVATLRPGLDAAQRLAGRAAARRARSQAAGQRNRLFSLARPSTLSRRSCGCSS
jgi:glutamate dehydrogenase